ncbi:hypothetical protein [Halorussus caseinilyticus]|uniref:Uncharacterized protein n=1 Tax=Halorussus caseinilyticus TaxID=3034025 RepID=A0ABD5WP71_9EURY|nr:hypothetical protein [Halorussus sp. DT72]
MIQGVIDWLFLNVRKAVAIVLITFLVAIIVAQYYDTGKKYARIGEDFRGKAAVAVALIIIALGSSFTTAILQPHLIRIFRDIRMLVSALGLICFAGLYLANQEVDEWNVNDGSRFMLALALLGLVLTFGPWVYESILQWMMAQIPFI